MGTWPTLAEGDILRSVKVRLQDGQDVITDIHDWSVDKFGFQGFIYYGSEVITIKASFVENEESHREVRAR